MIITIIETNNSKKGKYAAVYGYGAWPERVLRHRGWWDARVLYTRPAHPEEIAEQQSAWRYLAYRYEDWDTLVSDERKFDFDANKLMGEYLSGLRRL